MRGKAKSRRHGGGSALVPSADRRLAVRITPWLVSGRWKARSRRAGRGRAEARRTTRRSSSSISCPISSTWCRAWSRRRCRASMRGATASACPEWRVVVTLGQYGVMTAKAIGAHTHMHKTKVSRAVALLEKRRLIARRANRDDMRETFLSLTAAGRTMYEEVAPHALEFARRLTEISVARRPRGLQSRATAIDGAVGGTCRRSWTRRRRRVTRAQL